MVVRGIGVTMGEKEVSLEVCHTPAAPWPQTCLVP
jgi:hypothetical protein